MTQNKLVKLFVDSYSGISKEIWMLSFVTLVNRTGAMVLPFLSLYLTVEEGYTLSTAGTILLFYGIGSFFGNYYGGILTDKLGAFRVQFVSLVTTAGAFWMLSYMHSPVSMAIGLFTTSLLTDTFRPANMAAISILESEEKRTKAVGVIRLAINIGFSAGPAFGGIIAYSFGYQWLFGIDAITCFLAAFFLLYFFRTQFKEEGVKKEIIENEEKPSVRLVFKDKVFFYFLFFVFTLGIVFMQLFNSLPVFFKQDLAFNESQIGLLMASNGVLVVILELPMIQWLENRSKIKLISLGTLIIGSSYLVLLYNSWAGVAVLCLTLFSVGEILTLPFITSAIMNRAPDSLRGRYLAFYGMAFSVCHVISPVIGMQIADNLGFSMLWLFIGLLAGVTGFGYWRLRKVF